MIRSLAAPCALALALAACSDSSASGAPAADASAADGADAASPDATDAGAKLTLDSCATSIADDVGAFYKQFFRCVTITRSGTGTVIASKGLPPHDSYYWGASSPNYAPFDTSRGAGYHPNPNTLSAQTITITVPDAPVARTNVISAATVDGVVGTSPNEYPLGPVGVALDGVALYNPLAAPGDQIANERFTFDDYDAHPDNRGSYHYHSTSKGPREVLARASVADTELYGIFCDGTLMLGCTELDGSAPAADLDAQNGHVGDLARGGVTFFAARYHTHVCAALGGHPYTPEIQLYDACTR